MHRVSTPNRPRPRRAALTCLLALILGAPIAGCGAGVGEVRGTVRYNGKPLSQGTIQFRGSDAVPHAVPIGADGTYSVLMPAGPARVIVRCVDEKRLSRFTAQLAGRAGRVAPPPLPSGNFSLIPSRYADWETSGLSVLVEPGITVQDFALTSR